MNADGSSVQRLTTDPERDMFPDWSPDGKQIVFVSYRNGGIRNLWIMNADGSNIRQLTPDTGSLGDMNLTWSPDGMNIYFISNRLHNIEICEINVDGSGLRQITYLADDVDISHSLSVSPDRIKLAVYGVGIDVGQNSQEIYVINVDGSGLTDITLSPGQEEWLDW